MPKPAASLYPLLLIDSTQREKVNLAIISGRKVFKLTSQTRAQAVPELIVQILSSANLTLERIRAVAVCNQPGSLTGTRIGVTIANTLVWLNRLPIIELPTDNFQEAIRLAKADQLTTRRQSKVRHEVVH